VQIHGCFWFGDLSPTLSYHVVFDNLQFSIFNAHSLPPAAAKLKGKFIPSPVERLDKRLPFFKKLFFVPFFWLN